MRAGALLLVASCAQFDATFDSTGQPVDASIDRGTPPAIDAWIPPPVDADIDAIAIDAGFAPLVPMPTPRGAFGTAVGPDGEIFVIGGSVGNTDLPTVESYAPARAVWTARASLPEARIYLGAALGADDLIYAIGGSTASMGRITLVEATDPAGSRWSPRAPMPTARAGLAVVAAGGSIYAIGGGDDNDFLGAVEVYSLGFGWMPRAGLASGRERLAAAAGDDGRIYAVGGYRVVNSQNVALGTLEIYDPAMNQWSMHMPMPTRRWSLAAAAAGGLVYAIGGKNTNSDALATIEAYDPQSDAWTQLPDMPTARRNCGAALAADGRIYVIGGHDRNDQPLATVEAYDPAAGIWYR